MTLEPDLRSALTTLRIKWGFLALLCMFYLAGGFMFLRDQWHPDYANRWLLLALPVIIYLLAVVWRNLPTNHRLGEERLLPGLGWGNLLSMLRGVLLAGLAGFLISPRPEGWLAWIPGIIYTLSDATDYLDGYLARLTNHATRLGEILDMSLDGLGVLTASTLAVAYGQVPPWYLSVALARYLWLVGIWLRKRLGKTIYELPPSLSRRGFAGLQMGLLAVMLWPIFTPPGTHIAASLFALPFLVGFTKDWLYVTGAIQPGFSAKSGLQKAILGWLPVGLRLAVLGLVLPTLLGGLRQPLGLTPPIILYFEIFTTFCLLLGIAGRTISILALILLGVHQLYLPLTAAQIALAVTYTAILYMGSGQFSLWKAEDTWIYRKAGEKRVMVKSPALEQGK